MDETAPGYGLKKNFLHGEDGVTSSVRRIMGKRAANAYGLKHWLMNGLFKHDNFSRSALTLLRCLSHID